MKLFATDLDGTLLNQNNEISPRNLQAIKNAQAQGIEVVVATGRSYEAARKPMQAVGLDCPVICMNGARTYTKTKEIIRSIAIKEKNCKEIKSICLEEDLYFEVYTNDGIYSKDRERFMDVIMDIIGTANPEINKQQMRDFAEQRFQDEQFKITNDFDSLFASPDIEVFKILAFSHSTEKAVEVREKLKDDNNLVITSSGHDNLEFNHPDAQKGFALKQFAETLGIEMKDVMAIGDNLNDLNMLKMAGRSVAMGNAAEEVKKQCHYVTTRNTEDGVAVAIEEMLNTL